MSAKEDLIRNVRGWIEIDNEIKAGQKRLKELRQEKKQVTSVLVEVMKQNEIDCFDINDGKLVYKQNKQKAPLSKKHLLQSLSKYFPGNNDQVENICSFIMNSREEKIKESIERKK